MTIAGDRISSTYSDNSTGFQTYSPGDTTLVQRLEEKNITINARPENDGSGSLISALVGWLPMLLILGVWIFLHAPDAVRLRAGHGFWQIEGQASD